MKTIKALLSCPNDVINTFRDEIIRAVDDVNFYIEKILDTHIEARHYLTSSYSQVGKPAQDHLDDTLIIDSDICLAFYYHRLGTPTKNYKSGADEEIHLMWGRGKHVSLFRIFDSENDTACEEPLNEYFKTISEKSMYKTIIGKEKIFDTVRTDILIYLVSSFNVELLKMDEPIDAIAFYKSLIRFDDKKNEIAALINKINKLTETKTRFNNNIETLKKNEEVSKQAKEFLQKEKYSELLKLSESVSSVNFMKSEATIDDVFDNASKQYLDLFIKENSINLNKEFLSFQGEKIYKGATPLNGGLFLEGCSIKEKIQSLDRLSELLKIYYGWCDYLKKYEDIVLIPLAISNNTTSFQQSINVSVHINKEDYISKLFLVPEGIITLEIYTIGLDAFLNPYSKYYGSEEYRYPPLSIEEKRGSFPDGLFTDYESTIGNWFNEMFDYEVESARNEITLKLGFTAINAGETHCFPTYIILKKTAKEIRYDICGSSLPRKQFGKIELKKG